MAEVTTYVQGSHIVQDSATIRIVWPATAGTPSDWSISEGQIFNSVDEVLTSWQEQLDNDLGAGNVTLSLVKDTAQHTATIEVLTSSGNFDLVWSQTGTAYHFRNWLGATDDFTDEPGGLSFPFPHCAGWYPAHAAREITRASTTRYRARQVSIDGSIQSSHNSAIGDVDDVRINVELRTSDGGGALEGHSQFESFLEHLYEQTGCGEPFSIYHGGDRWLCRFGSDVNDLRFERVPGALPDKLWSLRLTLDCDQYPEGVA